MKQYNPDIHHRHSIRLQGYDYSQEGLYFITMCVQNRKCIFGEISNGEMILNDNGKIIEKTWLDLPNHNPPYRTKHILHHAQPHPCRH